MSFTNHLHPVYRNAHIKCILAHLVPSQHNNVFLQLWIPLFIPFKCLAFHLGLCNWVNTGGALQRHFRWYNLQPSILKRFLDYKVCSTEKMVMIFSCLDGGKHVEIDLKDYFKDLVKFKSLYHLKHDPNTAPSFTLQQMQFHWYFGALWHLFHFSNTDTISVYYTIALHKIMWKAGVWNCLEKVKPCLLRLNFKQLNFFVNWLFC